MALLGLKQVDILKKIKPICKKYNIKMGSNDLSQYVTGKVEPSQKKLTALAEVLGTNEIWLMGYDVPFNVNNSIKEYENKTPKEIEHLIKNVNKKIKKNHDQQNIINKLIKHYASYKPADNYEKVLGLHDMIDFYEELNKLYKMELKSLSYQLTSKNMENEIVRLEKKIEKLERKYINNDNETSC